MKKKHTAEQRALIAQAIIILKVLYAARHSWLSAAVVECLHQQLKRFVWGTRGDKTAPAWLSETQAQLPVVKGGMAVPHLRTEIITMSAQVVDHWATAASDFEQLLGDVLQGRQFLQPVFLTPSLSALLEPLFLASFWRTGASLVENAAAAHAGEPDIPQLRAPAARLVHAAVHASWVDGRYGLDVSSAMDRGMSDGFGH